MDEVYDIEVIGVWVGRINLCGVFRPDVFIAC